MPTRVSRPFCTVFKRTEDEKKLHAMGVELTETKSQLKTALDEIARIHELLDKKSK